MVRFVTAPIRSRKPLSRTYSTESGAVRNRTYRVGAKRLETAPELREYASDKQLRKRHGAVS